MLEKRRSGHRAFYIFLILFLSTSWSSFVGAEALLVADFGFIKATETTGRTQFLSLSLAEDVVALRYYLAAELQSANGTLLPIDRVKVIYLDEAFPASSGEISISHGQKQDAMHRDVTLGIRIEVEPGDLPGRYEGFLVLEPVLAGDAVQESARAAARSAVVLQVNVEGWHRLELDPAGPQWLELDRVLSSPELNQRILTSEIPLILRVASNQNWSLWVSHQGENPDLDGRVRLTTLRGDRDLWISTEDKELCSGPPTGTQQSTPWKTIMVQMILEDITRIEAGQREIPLVFRLQTSEQM